MDIDQAKETLMTAASDGGANLDGLADALLARIGQFFGKCVGGDTFCAFSIDEASDENGLPLSLRIVPCDLVSGEPVRRVGR